MKHMLNFWINVIIYLLMGFLLFSGFLIKFTMPPGTGGVLVLLGMDRHDWGVLHFWVAVALLIGVALHLWLHWSWMRVTTPHYFKRAWVPALIGLLILALAALAAPFFVQPTLVPGGGEKHEREMAESVKHLVTPTDSVAQSSEPQSVNPCEDCSEDCAEELPEESVEDAGEEGDAFGKHRRLREG
ncbi:DUF4405 domain-containing protein [bacterium]|nr:DUF4405 domain-containing protein [bacterium]